MDIIQLYQDFNIPIAPQEHRHCHEGWVHTPCPFCTSEIGHEGYHLGFPLDGKFFICWRCGNHPATKTIAKLLRVSMYEAGEILKKYGGVSALVGVKKKKVKVDKLILPSHILPLTSGHKKYLMKRKFDPDKLEKTWGLVSTGPTSLLGKINYGNRILAPINWGGQPISFQTRIPRDVSKAFVKYLACIQEKEIMDHKNVLYGNQSKWTDTAIIVEGIFDAFRIGEIYGVATFGTSYKPSQVRLIARNFKRVAIMYDDELIAQTKAQALVSELCFRGLDAFNIKIVGDPGAMDQRDADCLVKEITTKIY